MSTPQEEAKKDIATEAARVIPNGCSIIIGAGSTVRLTCLEMRDKGVRPTHVITSSFDVPPILAFSPSIQMIGGLYHEESNSALPTEPAQVFDPNHQVAQICLLSVWGIAVTGNQVIFSFPNPLEVGWVRELIRVAGKRLIIVSNYTHLGETGLNRLTYSREQLSGHREVQLITNELAQWADTAEAVPDHAAATLNAFRNLGFTVIEAPRTHREPSTARKMGTK